MVITEENILTLINIVDRKEDRQQLKISAQL